MSGTPERLEAVVRGRVQGVAFRWYTQREARRLGLTGWVRNQPDGSVRLVAEGEREGLDRLWAWLAHGPERARVTDRRQHRGEASGRFADFTIDG